MSYNLHYWDEARAQLKALDKSVLVPILKKIRHLKDNPQLQGEPLSNVLKNKRRLHVGKYRVVYLIEGENVIIARVGHRKDVYE